MHARHRRPTIRKVRDCDWDRGEIVSLRPPRVPLDLVKSVNERETVRRRVAAINDLYENEEEKPTLARHAPLQSDVHEILPADSEPDTIAYIRKAQGTISDPDSALDNLVSLYGERIERLEKQRREAESIVPPSARQSAVKTTVSNRDRKTTTERQGVLVTMRPHFWKIVYASICVWGLLQLAFTR